MEQNLGEGTEQMYLLEKYNLVFTLQAGLSRKWLEFSTEAAYELAYA